MRFVTKESLASSILAFMLTAATPALASDTQIYQQNTYSPKIHVVKIGQSLSSIAQLYGYSVALLAHHNNIGDPSQIVQGQVISLPVQSNAPINTRMYPKQYETINPHETYQNRQYSEVRAPDRQFQDQKDNIFDAPAGTSRKTDNDLYSYFGNNETLNSVLSNFAGNYGIPIIITENVTGMVNGNFGPLTSVEFLDTMAKIHNLIWYFDGNTLYIYNSAEIDKEIISLQFLNTHEFKNTLIDMGIWDNRFYWRSKSNEGLIYLSGPPRYMELVTETARLLDSKAGLKQKSKVVVKVFPLKYAWADDRSFTYRNEKAVIPGVASILRDIISGGSMPTALLTDESSRNVMPKASPANHNPNTNGTKNTQQQDNNAFINADRRLNAVIINDLESKMSMYSSLIETLDKPLAQVEINVSIIDINTDSLNKLGVNWRLNVNKSGSSFIDFNPFQSANIAENFNTIIKNTSGRLLAQVNLLSSKGKAKVLARPSVLTLDNMEAVLDNSQTFYVEVASSDDAQLFPVTYGSVLKVTPRIVEEHTGRKIHLNVNIQDGTRGNIQENVKEIPTIKNSSISTQAVINENESLLIGGYYYESNNNTSSKVPLLGDLPFIGKAFQYKSDNYVKNVRLFLIAPKIVGMK